MQDCETFDASKWAEKCIGWWSTSFLRWKSLRFQQLTDGFFLVLFNLMYMTNRPNRPRKLGWQSLWWFPRPSCHMFMIYPNKNPIKSPLNWPLWGYPPVITGGFWTLSIHEDFPLPRVDYGSGYHICRDKHTRTYYIGSLFHEISPLKNPYDVGAPQL